MGRGRVLHGAPYRTATPALMEDGRNVLGFGIQGDGRIWRTSVLLREMC